MSRATLLILNTSHGLRSLATLRPRWTCSAHLQAGGAARVISHDAVRCYYTITTQSPYTIKHLYLLRLKTAYFSEYARALDEIESPKPTVFRGLLQIRTGARKNSVSSERHIPTGWSGERSIAGLEYERDASMKSSELEKVPSSDPQAL